MHLISRESLRAKVPIVFLAFARHSALELGSAGATKSQEVMSWNVLVKRVVNLSGCCPHLHEINRQNMKQRFGASDISWQFPACF